MTVRILIQNRSGLRRLAGAAAGLLSASLCFGEVADHTPDILPPGAVAMKNAEDKVTPGSKWKYLNPLDGRDPALAIPDFHKKWTTLTFDDSKWTTGATGMMGYGTFAVGDAVAPPTTDIGTPEKGKRYTAYFRHVFFVNKGGLYDVEFVLARDDGAIIYINGKEEARSFEAGAVEFANATDSYELLVDGLKNAWTDGPGELAPHQHFMRGIRLNAGNNILAVSVHNNKNPKTATSSDLGMMIRYVAIAPPGSAPVPESPPSEPAAAEISPQPLAGPAAPDAFDKLSSGEAPWSMSAAGLETHFAGHRFQWLDAQHLRAQITSPDPGAGDTFILNGQLPVLEAHLDMAAGKLARVQYHLYTRGDSGDISKQSFAALIEKCKTVLTVATGAAGRERPVTESPKSAVKTSAMTWNGSACLYLLESSARRERAKEPFVAEFVRLTVVPSGQAAKPVGAPTTPASDATTKRGDLPANLKKDDNGDVFIHNVPMVDQGETGYCAVASAERVMRYYGIATDQHELAQVADSSASDGTNPATMYAALSKLRGRFKFQLREVIPWKYENFIKLVKDYNEFVRKTDDPYVKYPKDDGIDPVIATMNGEVLKKIRAKPDDIIKFRRKLALSIDAGVPLMWGVHLGIFPEAGLPQTSGGHMRLILGYNDKTNEVLYSDSWGSGHELKRMPLANALVITDQIHVIRPAQ